MELNVLHRHGWTVSQLAREFGISRTTVYKELASEAPRRYAERAKPTALNEAQVKHVERRLEVCPKIRGTILHEELRRDYGYQGSYPAFERHLRLLRPAQVRDPEVRFETDPGWQTQADWALCGIWPLGHERAELSALVTILGYSRTPAVSVSQDVARYWSSRKDASRWPVVIRPWAMDNPDSSFAVSLTDSSSRWANA